MAVTTDRPPSKRQAAARPATVQLPFMPPPEIDYAAGFRKLARLHVRARREGVTKTLALQRAHVLFSVGNPMGAAFDCERALRLDGTCGEAHFLKGLALLAMAGVKEGIVAPGPGAYMPRDVMPPRRDLLWAAYCCFEKALMCNPQDQQASKARKAAVQLMQNLAIERRPKRPLLDGRDASKEAKEPLSSLRQG